MNWMLEADARFAQARIHDRIDRMALNALCEIIKLANMKRDEIGVLASWHSRSAAQKRRWESARNQRKGDGK